MSGPGGVAGDRLRAFIERIERLEEDIKGLNKDKQAAEWSKGAGNCGCRVAVRQPLSCESDYHSALGNHRFHL